MALAYVGLINAKLALFKEISLLQELQAKVTDVPLLVISQMQAGGIALLLDITAMHQTKTAVHKVFVLTQKAKELLLYLLLLTLKEC